MKILIMVKSTLRRFLGLIFIAILSACGSEDQKSLVDASKSETNLPAAQLPSADPTTNAAVAVAPPVEQMPSGASPQLNPAHGQPGHRCDLAVGAALPGAAPATAPPVAAAPASNSTANNSSSAPKLNLPGVGAGGSSASPQLNPAHGQPGHRCDLEVGAPLPGSTAQPAQSPITTNNRLANNPAPALNLPTSNAAIKLNPAHGQPGHRCDLAVGAPLK